VKVKILLLEKVLRFSIWGSDICRAEQGTLWSQEVYFPAQRQNQLYSSFATTDELHILNSQILFLFNHWVRNHQFDSSV